MRTHATEVSRHVGGSLDVASGSSLADIGSVIPCPCGADAHPVHENIPEVPFAQQDPVAGELTPVVALRCVWTGYIGPLKMRAEENRTWSGSIAGQKPLRTPHIQVMPEQEHIASKMWVVPIETLEATHGAEAVGADGPGKTRHEVMCQARSLICSRSCSGSLSSRSRVKQSLSAAIAVVLNSQPVATNRLRGLWSTIGGVGAEPCSHLKSDSLDPFVFYLGERLDVDVS